MASMNKRGAYDKLIDETERKRRRKERDRTRRKGKVYLGDEVVRWNRLKVESGVKNNRDWARVLLDSFQVKERTKEPTPIDEGPEMPPQQTASEVSTGEDVEPTPGPSSSFREYQMAELSQVQSTPMKGGVGILPQLSASEISSAEDVEPGVRKAKPDDMEELKSRKKRKAKDLSSIYGDPLSISLSIIEEEEVERDDGDHLYEPSFDLTLELDHYQDSQDVAMADIIYGTMEEGNEEPEEILEVDVGTGVTKALDLESVESFLDDDTALIYCRQLQLLADHCFVGEKCKRDNCKKDISSQKKFIGSILFLTWVCPEGHVFYKWASQPLLNRMVAFGDMMISTAILTSGNNFAKINLFAKCLSWHIPHRSTFERIQRSYVVPSIDKFWNSSQDKIITELKDKEVVCLGDGRMDSPGHCAQYCSYTMMDNESKKVVSIKTLDKREVEKKSSSLEKAGFIKCVDELLEKGVHVKEIVTDAHPQIGSLMKLRYQDIKHSFDIWHAAKNLCKKIVAAGQDKETRGLQQWSRDVTNHFWYACKEANTKEEWMAIWCGVMHHVCNEHSWAISYGDLGAGECSHGELNAEERTKQWLTKGSPAHAALVKIVLNTRLINQVPYFLNFRHTSETENFQNHILMYAGKRFAYTPPVYKARNLLAAMDHNEHVGRPVLRNKQGEICYRRSYNKKSGRWSASPAKVEKTYPHLRELFQMVLCMRLDDDVGMRRGRPLSPDDPRLLSPNIAPTLPQTTKEIVESQKSRHT